MNRLVLIISLLFSIFVFNTQAAENLVVVVNKNNPVNVMEHSEVIDLFMGKYVAFPSGTKAIAVDLNDKHISREAFYQKLIGRSLASVNAYWSRIRFSGKRKPPIQKPDYTQVVTFIENTNTSIGYIPKSMVSSKMKVVFEFD